MNVRVTVEKTFTENFGIGRSHTSTISYNVDCDVTHVSTVAKVAAEKGYRVTYVGEKDWNEDS